jgi:hypothetical protein
LSQLFTPSQKFRDRHSPSDVLIKDERKLCRNASQLKPANSLVGTEKCPMQAAGDEEEVESTWDRETVEETADSDIEQVKLAENEGIDRLRRERQQPARLRDYIPS